ncbi:MAG: ATP-binding protein [Promethearchaeota archaeon]
MKGITQKGLEKHKFFNALFEAIIDKDSCINCGTCVDRCPVEAITLEECAIVDREKCLGCGLCTSVCPEEAIIMHLREDGGVVFNRVYEMGMEILKGKQKIVDTCRFSIIHFTFKRSTSN